MNHNKIKNHFETTKTKTPEFERSGIYQISCKTQRCGYKYIGPSRRQIQTRFIEHLRAFKDKKQEEEELLTQFRSYVFRIGQERNQCKQAA
jgi:hypothetical protein